MKSRNVCGVSLTISPSAAIHSQPWQFPPFPESENVISFAEVMAGHTNTAKTAITKQKYMFFPREKLELAQSVNVYYPK